VVIHVTDNLYGNGNGIGIEIGTVHILLQPGHFDILYPISNAKVSEFVKFTDEKRKSQFDSIAFEETPRLTEASRETKLSNHFSISSGEDDRRKHEDIHTFEGKRVIVMDHC